MELLFLNYGYEEDPPMALPLAPPDEHNRYCFQQYHLTAAQVELKGKRVLEVGCGHGGGASYLMRTLHPASFTGLDLNPAAIALCRKKHMLAGLDFVRGDAEDLPFPDQSFDAVVNIESSHGYPRFSRFLAEVARVLRPGGHFLYADLRPAPGSPTGRQRWPTPPCGCFRKGKSMRSLCAGWREIRAVVGPDRSPLAGIPARLSPRKNRRARLGGSTARVQNGKISFRIYCFAKD